MGQLAESVPELQELGYQVVVISPDTPDAQVEILHGKKVDYVMLSDAEMKAARAFGVAFRMDDDTIAKYKAYGIAAEELPVPSIFVVRKGGAIAFQHADPDYKSRLEPDVLVAAARAARATR